MRAKAAALPQLRNVQVDLKLDSLTYNILVDRDQAAALGLTEAEIGLTLGSLFGGSKAGRFEQIGQSWLKHGFRAFQDPLCSGSCIPTTDEYLGVNCSDPYGAGWLVRIRAADVSGLDALMAHGAYDQKHPVG